MFFCLSEGALDASARRCSINSQILVTVSDRLLRSRLRRNNLCILLCELKPQPPFACHTLSIHFWRREGPLSRGLQSQIREKRTGPCRIQLCSRYAARRINVYLYTYAYLPLDGSTRLRRYIRQNLIENFAPPRTSSHLRLDFATSSEAGAFADVAAEVASSLSLVGFKVSRTGGGGAGLLHLLLPWELLNSLSGKSLAQAPVSSLVSMNLLGSAGFDTALWPLRFSETTIGAV